jgi:hypothetical protein
MIVALVLLVVGLVGTAAAAPPNVNLESPTTGASRNATPVISGTTDDSLDPITVGIDDQGEDTVQTFTVMPVGTAWSTPAANTLPDGTYTAFAEQTNAALEKETSGVTFTVDTTPPAVGISTPADKAHVHESTPSFSGPAGHAEGDLESVTLTITPTSGSAESFPIERHKGSSWSESEAHLPDGTYTAQIAQSDSAGNKTEVSHSFTIETGAPRVTLNALPASTSNATPSFSGSVDTTKGALKSIKLRVYPGASAAESQEPVEELLASAGGGAWSTGASAHLADGTYTAQAEQVNSEGEEGFSAPSTFTVDTVAPQVSLGTPVASNGLELVSGSAGTASGDLPGVTIQVFSGAAAEGSPVETIGVAASAGNWSAALGGLGSGLYTVRALQSDEAGNLGVSSSGTFSVSSPAGPIASFTWVPASPYVGQSVSLVSNSAGVGSPLTGLAWDPAGNEHFVAGGPVLGTSFSTPGGHIVRLRVTDANGLASVATERINVTTPPDVLMQPFPVVRIVGSVTSSGAKLKVLSVQAPLSTMISITCKGHGCKTKSESRLAIASKANKAKAGAVTLAFQHFERSYKAGAVLQVRVTKAGQIGKYTSFKIRHHKFPVRSDACLRPTSPTPIACPSS